MTTNIRAGASGSFGRRRRITMNLQRSIVTMISTLAASACLAQSAIVSGAPIKLDQSKAETILRFKDSKGAEQEKEFDDEKHASLRVTGSESIKVRVDKNPVLFTYVARDVVKTPTANKQAADQLADALSGFLDQLKGAPPGVAARPGANIKSVQMDGVDLLDLGNRIRWVMRTWESLSPTIDQTLDPDTLDTARATAEKWEAELRAGNPTDKLKGLGALWQKLLAPGETFTWLVEYSNGERKIGQTTRANLAGELRTQGGVTDADVYLQMIVAMHSERNNIAAQVADISDLADAISSIAEETVATVKPDIENDQSLPIEITANPRFLSLLSAKATSHQAKRLGTYTIVFSPYDWVHMRPSIGVIYSFVKAPKFSAERDDTGQLSVASSSDDYAEYSGLVSMDFTLDKYFYSGLQPFVQFGVAPSSDNLGLVLGAGIRAYKAFTFSLGVTYQRVERLSGTLAVGEVIEEESDLKTSKEFKAGLYLGIAVALE